MSLLHTTIFFTENHTIYVLFFSSLVILSSGFGIGYHWSSRLQLRHIEHVNIFDYTDVKFKAVSIEPSMPHWKQKKIKSLIFLVNLK